MLKVLLVSIALIFAPGCSLFSAKQPDHCNVRWVGSIGEDFYQKAVADLDAAKDCSVLRIDLTSPGGSIFSTLDTVQAMRDAENKGLVVEIHGGSIVASGATFVMAAGSKGRRYVRDNSLNLVHGVQVGGFGGSQCQGFTKNATSDRDKEVNQIIVMLAREYAGLSGHPVSETYKWLACDNTQVGFGAMLVRLGLADHVEG